MSYTPRPGSKTEAAIEFIRRNGGIATRMQIEDATDINRRDMNAIFSGALNNGAMDACQDEHGASAFRIPPEKPETRAEQLQRELKVTKAIPAMRNASPALWPTGSATKPKEKAKTVRQMARKTKVVTSSPDPVPPIEPEAPIATPAGLTFLCGRMSEGLLRIEGADGDLAIEQFVSGVHVITLSRAAASKLTEFIRGD